MLGVSEEGIASRSTLTVRLFPTILITARRIRRDLCTHTLVKVEEAVTPDLTATSLPTAFVGLIALAS